MFTVIFAGEKDFVTVRANVIFRLALTVAGLLMPRSSLRLPAGMVFVSGWVFCVTGTVTVKVIVQLLGKYQ